MLDFYGQASSVTPAVLLTEPLEMVGLGSPILGTWGVKSDLVTLERFRFRDTANTR